MIEGQVNKTLMRLGNDFKNEFGGQLLFWLDIILDFSQNEKYDQGLRIWHVLDNYKRYLHLPIEKIQSDRQLKRILRNDIQITRKLILGIGELRLNRDK